MSISVGSDYYLNPSLTSQSAGKAAKLQTTLEAADVSGASDEELLGACREFEAYLVEQVLKGMEKTIPKDEDEEENSYVSQFGDMFYNEVSNAIANQGGLGLAQQLYESMKRNQGL